MDLGLILLAEVRWRGRAVAGERPRALLAALAGRECRAVPAGELIEVVWGDDTPANGLKALQVLVSRVRTACGADVIVRDGTGYRLSAALDEVDSCRLGRCAREAAGLLERDPGAAAALAREAMTLAGSLPSVGEAEDGPLANVRRTAAADAAAARMILARAASRTGDHAAALTPIEEAHGQHPGDEALLADLLRSEGAVRGPSVALARYERYRSDLRERLGTDPGEPLRREYRTLLALDRPVRQGVRHDATELIGRDLDRQRLGALLAASRVVSIVGPGGIGKTRLAHAVARAAAEPSVHVIELVGVTSAEDVVAEVGSALGVRDSVAGRRAPTPGQRADIRARIASLLGQAPCLLMLDNCEHLIEAVADLVAFLVTAAPDLRVLTTSRAPLSIAAERVYPLSELGRHDAARLFTERAVAARPGVRLPGPVVARIVTRLDGLPLAIELAAARIRAMSADEIDRRLEDRFALLRGGDRSAPDRHQTLLAVIEWSWNLLRPQQRRALGRLALFHDGFTLPAAEEVLGPVLGADAVDAVQGLVDQSLLGVVEAPGGTRYRMLETVREFGLLRLADTGTGSGTGSGPEEQAARTALRRWASGYASRHGDRIAGSGQYDAVDALAAEETNLADELRSALSDHDRETLVRLLSALGLFWTMRGDHGRLVALAEAVADALGGWSPPPELAADAQTAVAVALSNSLMTGSQSSRRLSGVLRQLPDGEGSGITGLVRVLLAYDADDIPASLGRLERLADDADRRTAGAASHWLSHLRENAGDLEGATKAAERALDLVTDEDGPWMMAVPHTILSDLLMGTESSQAMAVRHAQAALPVMERIGAGDDVLQLRSAIVLSEITSGRLAEAADALEDLEDTAQAKNAGSAGRFVPRIARAELLLARGEAAAGLRVYRESAILMRNLRIPGVASSQMQPWTLAGDATALSAHAQYASGEDEAHGRELLGACREHATRVFGDSSGFFDFPAAGLLLFALGSWGLLHGPASVETSLRLLALARRFRYGRGVPSMAWDRITPAAEKAAPGLLACFQSEYSGREPADLLAEAGRLARAAS